MSVDPNGYATREVISRDGTSIGYRQLGRGPGLVMIHGGMMAAQSLMKLAAALASDFTVSVPDRRGRGSSGPFGPDFGLHREVEDIAAILDQTEASDVFGLSSGAIVALESALQLSAIRRLAIYEPPLTIGASNPGGWLLRYDMEIAGGDLPAAMVTVSKGVPVSPVFSRLPRFLGTALMRLAIPAEAKQTRDGDVSLEALIPTMHFDAQVVTDAADSMNSYRGLTSRVLLLGGSRSPRSLKFALDALEAILPSAQRLEIAHVGHMAADNGGQPERVARVLQCFFTYSSGEWVK